MSRTLLWHALQKLTCTVSEDKTAAINNEEKTIMLEKAHINNLQARTLRQTWLIL